MRYHKAKENEEGAVPLTSIYPSLRNSFLGLPVLAETRNQQEEAVHIGAQIIDEGQELPPQAEHQEEAGMLWKLI